MKPQIIRAGNLTVKQQKQVIAWLKSNGCRYFVPFDSAIKVTGNYLTVETFTFKTLRQSGTLLPRGLRFGYVPTKIRKYRIRYDLRLWP